MRPAQKVETFPDGLVLVYPDSGRKLGELKGRLRFENQSVGVNRFYSSEMSISGNRIDRVIKVPHTTIADRLDIAVIQAETPARQYRILRIQTKPERGVDLWELEAVKVTIKAADEAAGNG